MDSGNIDISIVMVNYYSEQYTMDAIKSIIMHTSGVSYEIILVDNGSKGKELVEFCVANGVKLISNDYNIGFARANNQGFEIASGKYTLILNNDTVFWENTLRQLINFYETENCEKLIGVKLMNSDMSYQNSTFAVPTLRTFFLLFYLSISFSQM